MSAMFSEPVDILADLGFLRRIGSVEEAHSFLLDCTYRKASGARDMALKICRAALADKAAVGTARYAFVTFADQAGILALAPEEVAMIAEPQGGIFRRLG